MPRALWLLLVAEVSSASGMSSFPTLMPELMASWGLTPTDAGLINGAFFAGYALSSPVLTGLTDRHDARRIYLACAALSVCSQLAFALYAHDVFTASLCRALFGVGISGTFMPALALLPDLRDPARRSRAVSAYTATFGIGVSVSFVLTAVLRTMLDVQATLLCVALVPLLGLLIVCMGFGPTRPSGHDSSLWSGLVRALRHAPARRFALVYAGHCAELFALRSWSVVLLADRLGSYAHSPLFAPFVAASTNLIGAPFSLLGNEAALRTGRVRWIGRVLWLAPLFALALGASLWGPAWLTVLCAVSYAGIVSLDSGAMTAGNLESAPMELKGAVAALHTTLGFVGGFFGPLVVGVTLQHAGGPHAPLAWSLALALVSLAALVCGVPLLRAR